MYFGCCIYVLLLLNMPEMAHDWINKSILFYSFLFYSILQERNHSNAVYAEGASIARVASILISKLI